MSIYDRFEKGYEVSDTGCWEWKMTIEQHGYGRISYKGRNRLAHRVSAFLFLGFSLDSTKCVLHKCDNPLCVNPDHLYIGTVQQNMKDRDSRGRQKTRRGSKNHMSKLTEIKVREIRASDKSTYELARMYEVTPENISHIKKHKTWKHV